MEMLIGRQRSVGCLDVILIAVKVGCGISSSHPLRSSSWPLAGQPSFIVVGFSLRMALISAVFYFSTLLSAIFPFYVNGQDISMDMPVPPLQWLNLSGLLNGPSPPPLKDAAIGYDETRYVFRSCHDIPSNYLVVPLSSSADNPEVVLYSHKHICESVSSILELVLLSALIV
jgi:hypothetical protein